MVYLFFLFRPLKLIGEPIKLEESGFARKRRSHAPSTLAFMRGNSETVYIYITATIIYKVFIHKDLICELIVRTKVETRIIHTYCLF